MSVLVSDEPSFRNLSRQMGKMMDQVQKGYYNYAPSDAWAPSVNLYETEADYLVCVDLAGMIKEKIDITVENHLLRLQGHRPVPMEEPVDATGTKIRVRLMEIDHGSFSREVELPADV